MLRVLRFYQPSKQTLQLYLLQDRFERGQHRYSTRFAAMLQNKLHVVARFTVREFVGDFYSLPPIYMMHLHCSLEFYPSSATEVSSLFWDRRVRLVRLGRKIAACRQ